MMSTDLGKDRNTVKIDRLDIRIEWRGKLYPPSHIVRLLENVWQDRKRLEETCAKLRHEGEELLLEFIKRDKVIAERDQRIAELERR